MALCGAIFGVITSGGGVYEIMAALFYSFEGAFLGALLALAMNLFRMVR
jgi:hypothetical protein